MRVVQEMQIEAVRDGQKATQTDATVLANYRNRVGAASYNFERALAVLDHIEYREDYQMFLGIDRERAFMQPRVWRRDIVTGNYDWGYGGRGYVEDETTTSQIVQMAFGLFKAYEEHEAREHFRYRGARVFGPHIDIDELVGVAHITDKEFRS